MKRAWLEGKQMEMNMQMRREVRISATNDEYYGLQQK